MVLSEQLLRDYRETGSEQAFHQLVERHLALVFSTARRLTGGDAHLAEDIAQVVFRDLALKSSKLPAGTIVAGWLYRHTCFTASKMQRTNRRRALREEQSTSMNPNQEEPEIAENIEPALQQLGEGERNAIVLRYLEQRDWNDVGATLGVSVDAAQKRASRALEKLRTILERDGVRVSSAGLAAALTAQTQAAPAALSAQIAQTVLTSIATTMTTTTAFTTLLGKAAAVIAVGGLLALSLIQQQRLARANDQAAAEQAEVARLKRQFAELQVNASASEELERLRRENAELHKLRADVTSLRQQLAAAAKSRATDTPNLTLPPAETLPQPKQVTISSLLADVSPNVFEEIRNLGIEVPQERGSSVLDAKQAEALGKLFRETAGIDLLSAPRVTTVDGREARISIEETIKAGSADLPVGPIIEVLPTLSPDYATIELKLSAYVSEYLGQDELQPAVPRLRVREASAQAVLQRNQSVLLHARRTAESAAGDGRKLLVLVTPFLTNPDGTLFTPQ